jgi:hypothetical protein
MSKVYVVQDPMIMRDGRPERRFSLVPAEEYGELVFLLGWNDTRGLGIKPGAERRLYRTLRYNLRDFNDSDYLLMTGNWTAMAMAVVCALEHTRGFVSCLQWDQEDREYRVIAIDVNLDEDDENWTPELENEDE